MIRWIKRIIPIEFLAIFAAVFLVAEGFDRFVQIIMRDISIEPLTHIRAGVLVMGCIGYGFYRAYAFHPALRPEYRKWLIRTPWTRGQPLPIGPVHFIWQDAVIAGLAVLLAYYVRSPHAYWPAVAIVSVYFLMLTFAFSDRRLRPFMYAVLFGLGMMLRFYDITPVAVVIALIICAIIGIGTARSLELLRLIEPKSLKSTAERSEQRQTEMSWPFNRLSPTSEVRLDRFDAIWITLLCAWWLYVLQRLLMLAPADRSVTARVIGMFWLPLTFMIVGRLLTYCLHHRPPISLIGRIGTGRFIIPGYDKVFVAPLSALALGFILPWLLISFGMPRYYAYPITAIPTVGLILNGGPTFHQWRLTGRHRIVPALITSGVCEKL